MKVEINLSPKEVQMCFDWGDFWREHNPGEEYANSILTKVAKEVMLYDRLYSEVISD